MHRLAQGLLHVHRLAQGLLHVHRLAHWLLHGHCLTHRLLHRTRLSLESVHRTLLIHSAVHRLLPGTLLVRVGLSHLSEGLIGFSTCHGTVNTVVWCGCTPYHRTIVNTCGAVTLYDADQWG